LFSNITLLIPDLISTITKKLKMEQFNLSCISVYEVAMFKTENVSKIVGRKKKLSKKYSNLTFKTGYPLNETITVSIPHAETVAEILIPIANAMYKSSIEHGMTNHTIHECVFEGININEDGLSGVDIGT